MWQLRHIGCKANRLRRRGRVDGHSSSNDANGMPIPPFLPQTLTATISDNSAAMPVAKYAIGRLKVYGGYERIIYVYEV